jgi:hypothetical protein
MISSPVGEDAAALGVGELVLPQSGGEREQQFGGGDEAGLDAGLGGGRAQGDGEPAGWHSPSLLIGRLCGHLVLVWVDQLRWRAGEFKCRRVTRKTSTLPFPGREPRATPRAGGRYLPRCDPSTG